MRSDKFGLYYAFCGVEFEKTEQPQNAIAPNGLLFYIISAAVEKVFEKPDYLVKKAVLL